jgi:hypothetical protein
LKNKYWKTKNTGKRIISIPKYILKNSLQRNNLKRNSSRKKLLSKPEKDNKTKSRANIFLPLHLASRGFLFYQKNIFSKKTPKIKE